MNKVTNNVAAPTTFDAISGLVRGGLEATGKLAVAGTGGFTALTLNLADRLTRGASTEGLQRLAAQNAGAKGPAGALARALVLLDQLAKKHPVESIAGASLIPLVAAELSEGDSFDLTGTPTIFINGIRFEGSLEELTETINERLKE